MKNIFNIVCMNAQERLAQLTLSQTEHADREIMTLRNMLAASTDMDEAEIIRDMLACHHRLQDILHGFKVMPNTHMPHAA
jgi:hypothetical protein